MNFLYFLHYFLLYPIFYAKRKDEYTLISFMKLMHILSLTLLIKNNQTLHNININNTDTNTNPNNNNNTNNNTATIELMHIIQIQSRQIE